ncbi:hypothetical protein BZG02_20045 [Labilibaculum filiforme]|uniref:Phage tail collar domain-containing protein n=1 Tax=Labilibaculum filiforme TaxID=1940526 RepID=A0A2N3HQH2_9BACT|nr:phage tail protein [Labilibaculum filiforme]PKQ60293.1 hypothetical protein BZG02_20045 [Labilibaculum filiforme]
MMNIAYIKQSTCLPIGSITAFAGEVTTCNTGEENKTPIEELGWMVCDGRKLETHEYPELFATLGTLYGGKLSSGDEPSYFNIPDLRGMFLRGIGADDASTELRTKAIGGMENGLGSKQEFAVQKHVHVYTSSIPGTLTPGALVAAPVNNSTNPKDTTETPTESVIQGNVKVSEYETRPSNVFIYYLIKYRY